MATGSAFSQPPQGTPQSRPGYVDVDKLANSAGIVCVISQRRRSGILTFAIFREFERDGRTDRTSFIPEDLAPSAGDMIAMAIARMAELRATGKLPFPAARDSGADR